MKHLPYPRDYDTPHNFPIFAYSMAIVFTIDELIILRREHDTYRGGLIEELNTEFLIPIEIALVMHNGSDFESHVILDTAMSL
jgi:hypothetical protein